MKLCRSVSACATYTSCTQYTPRPLECRILSASEGDHLHYSSSLLMRKIERLMNAAITDSKDFKLANTEVVSCSHVSDVYLHGNLIARIGETWLELFDGGHQTATTKSRLNAILSAHGLPGERVFQKNYQWFFQSKDYGVIPFFSGMRIA